MAEESQTRITTGIEGLDELLRGGLVPDVSVMVEGTPGTGKSTIAMQYLLAGIARGEPGIYITLEETPVRVYRDARSFGWDLPALENEGKLRVVATSAEAFRDQIIGGTAFHEIVEEIGARRGVVDSVTMFQSACDSSMLFRSLLATLIRGLELEGLQVMLVRDGEDLPANGSCALWSRYTADALIVLQQEVVHSRRTYSVIEVVKTRGQAHVGGKHAYRIGSDGIEVFARALPPPAEASVAADTRLASGVPGLDDMLRGGFIAGSNAIVSGPSGAGKTLLMLNYLADGARQGEAGLFTSTEETPSEIVRLTRGTGLDLEGYMKDGLLDLLYVRETETEMDELLYRVRKRLAGKRYRRVAFDTLNSIERLSPHPEFALDGMVYLVDLLSRMKVTALLGYESPVVTGQVQITRGGISGLASTVLLLRLIEIEGDIRKGISVLKHRGSPHATEVRQMIIDEQGMRVLSGFEGYQGVLTGIPQIIRPPSQAQQAGAPPRG